MLECLEVYVEVNDDMYTTLLPHCILLCLVHQLFPLLIVTDQAHGGYKLDENEIAVLISLAAGVQMLFQVSRYSQVPRLCFHFSHLHPTPLTFFLSSVPLPPPPHIGHCVPNHSKVHWIQEDFHLHCSHLWGH